MALNKLEITITNPERKSKDDHTATYVSKQDLENGIRHFRVHPLIKNNNDTYSYHPKIMYLGFDCTSMHNARTQLTRICAKFNLFCCREDIYKCEPKY